MVSDTPSFPTRHAQAERNRDKILAAARTAFAEQDAEISMAEISRRAGVGMATLYRNFPGRRELLEALYIDEVNAVCEAAETVEGKRPVSNSMRGCTGSSLSSTPSTEEFGCHATARDVPCAGRRTSLTNSSTPGQAGPAKGARFAVWKNPRTSPTVRPSSSPRSNRPTPGCIARSCSRSSYARSTGSPRRSLCGCCTVG
jgi:AcrR family transcriptional regulator